MLTPADLTVATNEVTFWLEFNTKDWSVVYVLLGMKDYELTLKDVIESLAVLTLIRVTASVAVVM